MLVLQIFVALLLDFGSTIELSSVEKSILKNEFSKYRNTTGIMNYVLYTENSIEKPQQLINGNSESVHNSEFNTSNPTRIMVVGYGTNTSACDSVREAYLKKGPHNFICVDWYKIEDHIASRLSVISLGEDLGKFINFLCKDIGMSKKDLILIAHSMGTHIAGFAGKYLNKINNSLPIMIVLDPTSVFFNYNDCSSRVCNTDADFVESIQTNRAPYGFSKPIGDAAYYPNGGYNQPACKPEYKFNCNHLKAIDYFAEAVALDDFPARKCPNYKDFMVNRCGKLNHTIRMGSMESIGTKGIFYVPVNSKSPYGKGS